VPTPTACPTPCEEVEPGRQCRSRLAAVVRDRSPRNGATPRCPWRYSQSCVEPEAKCSHSRQSFRRNASSASSANATGRVGAGPMQRPACRTSATRCGTAPRGALACGPRPTGRPSFTLAGAEPNRSTCATPLRLERGLLGRLSRDLALPRLERFFVGDLTNIVNDVRIMANDLNLQGRTHRRPGVLLVGPSRLRLPL
jgi:hypothetical protein